MRDLRWDDVSGWFGPGVMGALPDLRVPGTPAEDWHALLDLVNATRSVRGSYPRIVPFPGHRDAAPVAAAAGRQSPAEWERGEGAGRPAFSQRTKVFVRA
ncbi:hypothetical protein AB0L59_25435 [Streptomyces sp. NPDC052109]|uniref:hypothetical protein n=1 Tax=Streptomyces sp. NPDC052109 TaxID=3155527 RepID=UPI003441099D